MSEQNLDVNDVLAPFPNERRGYTRHFNKVYAPLMRKWIKKWQKMYGVDSALDQPLAIALVQMNPPMIRALPTEDVAKHKNELESVLRLSAIANQDKSNFDQMWARRVAAYQGDAFAAAMRLYRSGYDSVSFNFYGGGDEGSASDIKVVRDGEEFDGDEVDEMDMVEFAHLMLPLGFGNDEPYYNNGNFTIDLAKLTYALETDVEVKRYTSVEHKGSLWEGVDIPMPDND